MKCFKFIEVIFLSAIILLASCQRESDGLVQSQLNPTVVCPQPSAVSVTNITQNSATVSWLNGGVETQWEIEIMATATSPTGFGVTTNTNSYEITGLIGSTSYDCYVRGICSPESTSSWSGPFTFTTN